MSLERHPCGRPQVIAKQANKKQGYKKGDVVPCRCELCGPVEARIKTWAWWGSEKHAGNYVCHKCHELKYARGEAQDTMWCRDCYLLPPLAPKKKKG